MICRTCGHHAGSHDGIGCDAARSGLVDARCPCVEFVPFQPVRDPSWDDLTGREPEEPPVITPRASLEAPGPSPGELARLRAEALLAIERNTRRAKELEESAEVLGKARNLLSVLILKGLDVAAEQIPRLLERYSGDTGRAAAELARSGLVELDRIRRKDPQGQGL